MLLAGIVTVCAMLQGLKRGVLLGSLPFAPCFAGLEEGRSPEPKYRGYSKLRTRTVPRVVLCF